MFLYMYQYTYMHNDLHMITANFIVYLQNLYNF